MIADQLSTHARTTSKGEQYNYLTANNENFIVANSILILNMQLR